MNINHKRLPLLIMFLVAIFLPLLACRYLTDLTEREQLQQKIINQDLQETLSLMNNNDDKKIIKNVDYSGNIAIKTESACEKASGATVTAYDDNTCKISLLYPHIYTLSDGSCNPADWEDKWNIIGDLDESTATCNIQYCNKPSFYAGTGKVRFSSSMVWVDSPISCTSKSTGDIHLSVEGFVLYPLAP